MYSRVWPPLRAMAVKVLRGFDASSSKQGMRRLEDLLDTSQLMEDAQSWIRRPFGIGPSTIWASFTPLDAFVATGLIMPVLVLGGARCYLCRLTTGSPFSRAEYSCISLRLRVRGILGVLGYAAIMTASLPFFNITVFYEDFSHIVPEGLLCTLPVGLACLLLTLMPTDDRIVLGSCWGYLVVALAVATYLGYYGQLWLRDSLWWQGAAASSAGVAALSTTLRLWPLFRRHTPTRLRLLGLWTCCRLLLCIVGLALLLLDFINAGATLVPTAVAFGLCASCLTTALCTYHRCRAEIIFQCGQVCNSHTEREMARASIAALITGYSSVRATIIAKRRFRVLPVAGLGVADLSEDFVAEKRKEFGNSKRLPDLFPTAHLAERTRPGIFGQCDAFVSHSWQDAPAAKCVKLLEWGASVGSNATIWLDKACIDRSDVDESLACLPYFVCSCKGLLILAGPTFTSRLWCAMELVAFVYMDGNREDICVVPLDDDGDNRNSGGFFAEELMLRFSAVNAQCTFRRDREKLLAAIESGFGSLAAFDRCVHAILGGQRVVGGSRTRTRVEVAPE